MGLLDNLFGREKKEDTDGSLVMSPGMQENLNDDPQRSRLKSTFPSVEQSRIKSTFPSRTEKSHINGFRVGTSTDFDDGSSNLDNYEKIGDDIDISLVSNWEELLDKLFIRNSIEKNRERDIRAIEEFLVSQNKENFMRTFPQDMKVDGDLVRNNTFDDGGSGIQISGEERTYTKEEMLVRAKHDFRITIKNSSEITTVEALAFVKALVTESNKREINLRAKNYWESDAIILYLDKEELYKTVKLLEDLKNSAKYGENVANAIKHFGIRQLFSASLSDDSYYGISMAHQELALGETCNVVSKSYGAYRDTFNGYMGKTLNMLYNKLLNKYNGNSNMITAKEMYVELVNYHKLYMLGDTKYDIPLWMNRRNYNEYIENKEKRKNNTI